MLESCRYFHFLYSLQCTCTYNACFRSAVAWMSGVGEWEEECVCQPPWNVSFFSSLVWTHSNVSLMAWGYWREKGMSSSSSFSIWSAELVRKLRSNYTNQVCYDKNSISSCKYVHVCMYVCMCVCMYEYVCMCVYVHVCMCVQCVAKNCGCCVSMATPGTTPLLPTPRERTHTHTWKPFLFGGVLGREPSFRYSCFWGGQLIHSHRPG